MDDTTALDTDGQVPGAARLADREAIKDLVTAYAYAVDDRDWVRCGARSLRHALPAAAGC